MARVMIVGTLDRSRLEASYVQAFTALDWDVKQLSVPALVRKHAKLGAPGRFVFQRIPVEAWVRRLSTDVVSAVKEAQSDLIVLFGLLDHIRVGALAQLRSLDKQAVIAWIWPDPMVNWSAEMSAMLPLVDVVATYSQATVPVFSALGAREVIWLPLASDPSLHGVDVPGPSKPGDLDVTFIGSWRPSREQLLNTLGDFDLKIWGYGWRKAARSNPLVRRAWQGDALFGADLGRTVRSSKVNLNLIDPSTYPAANMRVFELLIAGGLELSSACPEFEQVLRHEEHLFYFETAADLPVLVDDLLRRPDDRARVAAAGQHEVQCHHTYSDRARTLAQACGF